MTNNDSSQLLIVLALCIVPIIVIIVGFITFTNRVLLKRITCEHCNADLRVYGWQSIKKSSGKKQNIMLYAIGSIAAIIGGPVFIWTAIRSSAIYSASIVQQSGNLVVYDAAANSIQNFLIGIAGLGMTLIGGFVIRNLITDTDMILFARCVKCKESSEIKISNLSKHGKDHNK
ncbi:MAG: hypothetical protein JEZ06_17610 [Anaerolineaceae bacterium]|nr:hypothetical protein [Anaerolineaceae bacterium]